MNQSHWQHQTFEPIVVPTAQNPALQAFASGALVGIVLLVTVLLFVRSLRAGTRKRRHGEFVSGWGDLFRLLAGVVRGGLLLIVGVLLLGRVLFWPAGRRW